MPEKSNHDYFCQGVTSGKNGVIVDLLDGSDKTDVITALFRKTATMADAETDPSRKAFLRAYSEGFRHSLNILENLGPALEAYENIINPSIKIPLTQKEVDMLGR